LSLSPEFLTIICEFFYESRGNLRYIPNEERRFLCGSKITKRKGLPERVKKKVGEEVYPVYFALIKNPITIGGRTSNPAVGAIVIYRLATIEPETYKKVKKAIVEELRKRYNGHFRVIAGREEEIEK
jgi:hypothetical protein